ncbi:MAG TPA: tRNA lysidine(34) synthetase TilS [Thermoanaerobaculia bacterium]|jgi:tRNA(Ile)-lysidine synthetase-like protein
MDAVGRALARAAEKGLLPPGSTVLLAISGGADSMALLYGAAELAPTTGWRLSVAHVHHGWRGREADRDLRFVAAHARRLGLPFLSRRRDARAESRRLGLSPEAGARRVRYDALLDMAREVGASRIATAHQREDRIESYLLARERKGGLASLAGPRESRADGVVRPMLTVSRAQILEFLAARGLSFRRDASNGDLHLDRNRLRREVLATLGEKERNTITRRVERLARRRERLDRNFEEKIRPAIVIGRNVVIVDARLLERSTTELRRRAVLESAVAFAAPGKAPLTGREREQIVRLLAGGADFRFEAGRLIRFRRRGERFEVRLAWEATRLKKGNNRRAVSVILGDRRESLG